MKHVIRLVAAVLAVGLLIGGAAQAQSAADAREVVARAAEALGGADRIAALRTMRLRGYGHDPYQDGGSLITTEVTAPEKMTIRLPLNAACTTCWIRSASVPMGMFS